ncbi:hypothetical protein F5Y11DRAFT_364934 [Daldinia sp. FL1419]|nr:hypothetical protein F5Y11DRAFT_364934 [Daldinia sp. FL1419]
MASQECSTLDRIPSELIIHIFSSLPDTNSIQNFSRASMKLLQIFHTHESVILYRFLARHIKDEDPGVVKMAYLACQARTAVVDFADVPSTIFGGLKFLKMYAQRNPVSVESLQLATFEGLPELSKSIESVLDWVVNNMTPLPMPLKLGGKGLTRTEISRQRRILYTIDFMANFLTKFRVPERRNNMFIPLVKALWGSFSPPEMFMVDELMRRLHFFHKTTMDLPAAISLEIFMFTWTLNKLHAYAEHLEGFLDMKRKEVEKSGNKPLAWTPLVEDSSAFVKDTLPPQPKKDEILTEYRFYSPLDYERLLIKQLLGPHHWFFIIGDRDRCESVISKGPIWMWDEDTNPWDPYLESSKVVWLQDPTCYGFSGSAGQMVTLLSLCNKN